MILGGFSIFKGGGDATFIYAIEAGGNKVVFYIIINLCEGGLGLLCWL